MAKSTKPPVTQKTTDAGLEISSVGRINTLDALLKAANVDTSTWQVVDYNINKWDMVVAGGGIETMWQVKARLVPITPEGMTKEDLLAGIEEVSPRVTKRIRTAPRGKGRYLLEVSPFDLHLGMRSWAQETGVSYDPASASELMVEGVREITQRSLPYSVEEVLFVIGNDFLHYDVKEVRTANNTPQDASIGFQDMFRRGRDVLLESIELLKLVGPVRVLTVPGNHDEQTSLFLGEVIAAWYRNDKNVTVDASPTHRKYVQWGKTLLGFTHGKYEKLNELPALMAREVPQEWANATHREWHLGHKHKLEMDEIQNVRVRRLPSLAGKDLWHVRQGYGSLRAVEAYLWDKEDGYAGHININARRVG